MRESPFLRLLPRRAYAGLVFLLAAGALYAQDAQYRFTLDLGYRWSSELRGSRDLYRSQLNYGEGLKLLAGDFFLAAPQGANAWVDRFELKINSWGGEPYNTAQVRVLKAGMYELRFDYQNAQYFSAIPSLANPFFEDGNLRTQHQYDLSQRVARVHLTLHPEKRISPFVALQHTGRQGLVRTTISADGDEFLLGSRVDNGSEDLQFGATFRLPRFSLRLEQGIRWSSDGASYSASEFQTGNSTRRIFGRDIILSSYQGKADVSATIPSSTGIAVYQPYSWLSLRGKLSYSNASVDSDFADRTAGMFFSLPLAAFYGEAGHLTQGTVKKPSLFGDFSAEWQPVESFRLVERVTVRRFHISGSALTSSTFLRVEPVLEQGIADLKSSAPSATFLSLDSDTQELEGLYSAAPRLMLRLGHRYERKEVKTDRRLSWGRNVLVSGAAYDFSSRNRIALEYEFGRTNRPIFRTDPVDFHRLRLRGGLSPFSSLDVTGSITLFRNEDDLRAVDFTSRNRAYSLQLSYSAGPRVSLSAEYERSSVQSSILIIVPQTFLSDRSLYRERDNYAGASVSLLLARKATLSLGYSVLETAGNLPVSFHRPTARLEIPLTGPLVAYGQWNFFDYNEKRSFFPQDYGAHLAIFGLRVTRDRK